MEIRRSKERLRARAQQTAQAITLTQGTPRELTRRSTEGRNPSSANAKGRRVRVRVSALKVPSPSMEPASTTAKASHEPPISPAASAHAPVEKRAEGIPKAQTANSGSI